MNGWVLISLIFLFMNGAVAWSAEAASKSQAAGITPQAMRLLKTECATCHNSEKKKAGLDLTSREAMLRGGEDGPVVTPNKPEKSKLISAVNKDADPHMPPKKQLSEKQIQTLRAWIKSGSAWDAKAFAEDEITFEPVKLATLPAGYHPALATKLSPDGKKLAVARGGEIFLHKVGGTNSSLLSQIAAHPDAIQSLAWSPDGRWLASGAFRKLVLWDAESAKPHITITNAIAGIVTAIEFSPDSNSVVFADSLAGQAGFIRIVSLPDGKVTSWRAHNDAIYAIDLSSDGKFLATASGDKLIKVWEIASHKEIAQLEGHTTQVLGVAFNTNATQVISCGVDKQLKVWDIKTRERIGTLGNHLVTVTAAVWRNDSKVVFAAEESGALFSYANLKRHNGEQSSGSGDERKIVELPDTVTSLDAASDGKTIFAGTQSGTVFICNSEGRILDKLTAFESASAKEIAKGKPTKSKRAAERVSFIRDVLPALSKVGCNAGACHAKPEGQNGFKLSVFSYDPKSDYARIVNDARGRRIFPAAPEESLIIKKPTTAIPHEGGVRFERGSETYQLIVCWIRDGMVYTNADEPVLDGLAVTPKEQRYKKNSRQKLAVQAHYSDGTVRDVTRLAGFDSNDKEIAKVDEHGQVTIGSLSGQGVIVARYMGLVADSHILIPADRTLPEARYAKLARNNFIDELAYSQFQRLGLFPSDTCTDAEFLRRAKLDAIGTLPTIEEAKSFLADSDPNKRQKLIGHILDDPAHGDYWANKWADLLRPNPDRVGVKSVFILDQWLRESFRENK
ncbi:MAG TPA: DUF1549 domain-containing protein, partial [Verrucomicrobiae bacterium]